MVQLEMVLVWWRGESLAGLELESLTINQIVNSTGIHKEIVEGTSIRQSIIKSSVCQQ